MHWASWLRRGCSSNTAPQKRPTSSSTHGCRTPPTARCCASSAGNFIGTSRRDWSSMIRPWCEANQNCWPITAARPVSTRGAVAYWTAAAERAVRRAANTEAVRHFRRALALLGAEPDTPERAATELKILGDDKHAGMDRTRSGKSLRPSAPTRAR
jgi:hypothetical protein